MKTPSYHKSLETLHVGCLEPRAYFIPFPDKKSALSRRRENSQYFISLCGEWDFRFFKSFEDVLREPPEYVDEGGFEVFNYSVPSQAYVNVKSRVSASFTNSGKNGVKNVILHIDGIDGNYNSVLEVGDLASGESNFVENYITFGAANVEQKLTVYFTYDDNQGIAQTSEKKEYSVTVLDGSSNDEEVTEQATGEFVGPIAVDNSNNYFQYAIVILLLIIVAAAGIYVWRKKKD